MIPTLLVGDYLFVSKYSYGYSKHSFPFSLGFFSGRIFGRVPERGDVAVFKYPGDQGQGMNRTDYIKRIVGLPGDRIQVINGMLHINGKPVERTRIGDYVQGGSGRTGRARSTARCCPTAGATRSSRPATTAPSDNTPEFLVPADSYFVMGDNRDNSLDSRTQLMVRDSAARPASAPSSAGTCRPRTWSAARSSSSSRTIRRPQAGWSRGNGRRRSEAGSAASSWQSTEAGPTAFARPELLAEALTHRSAPRSAPRTRPQGRLPARQRTARIPRRPRAVAGHGRPAAAPLPARARGRAGAPPQRPRAGARPWPRSPQAIDLGHDMRLGDSERHRAAPSSRPSSPTRCEAVLGAIFLDGGFAAAAAFVERLWGERLSEHARGAARRQDGAAGMGAGAPACRCPTIAKSAARGRRTRRVFVVDVSVKGHEPGRGRGRQQARGRASGGGGVARTAGGIMNAPSDARRLRRHRRRAQRRQVDAGQRAGRLEGQHRLAQGADHAHAGDRHRHDRSAGRRPRAGRAGRHAGHLPRRQAAARARHGRRRLAGRRRRRRGRRWWSTPSAASARRRAPSSSG